MLSFINSQNLSDYTYLKKHHVDKSDEQIWSTVFRTIIVWMTMKVHICLIRHPFKKDQKYQVAKDKN